MVDAGGEVTVRTLTRVERGTDDPDLVGCPVFAARREAELRASLGELGVHDVQIAGFLDGGCAGIAAEIAVRFGPDGITGPPDHRITSRWVTDAWRRAGAGELLYATMAAGHLDRFRNLHDELGLFSAYGLEAPVGATDAAIVLACDLTDVELERQRRVLARYSSPTWWVADLLVM